ncbi:MAG: hypothetical protein R2744_04590 [Bacteroidales bacterium]
MKGKLFVSSGLGYVRCPAESRLNIMGVISVIAEVNPKPLHTRHSQGWVDEVIDDLDKLVGRVRESQRQTMRWFHLHTWVISWIYGRNLQMRRSS